MMVGAQNFEQPMKDDNKRYRQYALC